MKININDLSSFIVKPLSYPTLQGNPSDPFLPQKKKKKKKFGISGQLNFWKWNIISKSETHSPLSLE